MGTESETAMLLGQEGGFSEILLERDGYKWIAPKWHPQPEIPQSGINLSTTFL